MKGDYTKAKQITPRTKEIVYKRQGGRSITGVYIPYGSGDYHHYVERSSGGVGYEWNIVLITREEHRCYHDHSKIKVNGRPRYTFKEFETLIHNHLVKHYEGWTFDKCLYKKYKEEADYGVVRRNQP